MITTLKSKAKQIINLGGLSVFDFLNMQFSPLTKLRLYADTDKIIIRCDGKYLPTLILPVLSFLANHLTDSVVQKALSGYFAISVFLDMPVYVSVAGIAPLILTNDTDTNTKSNLKKIFNKYKVSKKGVSPLFYLKFGNFKYDGYLIGLSYTALQHYPNIISYLMRFACRPRD